MSAVLVVGSGAREHALAWKLGQSPDVTRLIVAPGNDGMPGDWERWDFGDDRELALRARAEKVRLAVIGPDDPLARGIVDRFSEEGVSCFGPTAAAAQIEASKSFAKEVMTEAQVPTARYFLANSLEEARKILRSLPWERERKEARGWVVKADGLALGKGVEVCDTPAQAKDAAERLISISGRLVIEEKLCGEEISWMAFSDGENCALLDPARDYKRLRDRNEGPNTGGMGAFSPVPGISNSLEGRIREEVFLPTLRELRRRGTPFRGVLYAGLMVDPSQDRFWVVEFNSRFGDPEAQVLLPRMRDDLFQWCLASAQGDLSGLPPRVGFIQESAVYVVAAARGYPGQPEKGQVISGKLEAGKYFSAAVKRVGTDLRTAGGRVFGSLGLGATLTDAVDAAYRGVSAVHFDGMQYRKDIGS